jgi:hypothetical protein
MKLLFINLKTKIVALMYELYGLSEEKNSYFDKILAIAYI